MLVQLLNGELKKIPRPRNAFMIFSSEKRREYLARNPHERNQNISAKLGEVWHKMSAQDKTVYYKMAKKEEKAHRVTYPNYSYKPGSRVKPPNQGSSSTHNNIQSSGLASAYTASSSCNSQCGWNYPGMPSDKSPAFPATPQIVFLPCQESFAQQCGWFPGELPAYHAPVPPSRVDSLVDVNNILLPPVLSPLSTSTASDTLPDVTSLPPESSFDDDSAAEDAFQDISHGSHHVPLEEIDVSDVSSGAAEVLAAPTAGPGSPDSRGSSCSSGTVTNSIYSSSASSSSSADDVSEAPEAAACTVTCESCWSSTRFAAQSKRIPNKPTAMQSRERKRRRK